MTASRPATAAGALAVGACLALALFAGGRAGSLLGRPAGGRTVTALYAGSLMGYMENDVGPSFHRATGLDYEGFGGSSVEIANEIKGGVRRGDVFVSASAGGDAALEGPANGSWVSWRSTFASSPLMLAYNPHSRFAGQLRRGVPWYRVLAEPGVLAGRTDPLLDPKGQLTVEAIRQSASRLRDPALAKALGSSAVYPETGLVGRLQAGQLDAGFVYAVEATGARLPVVPLTPVYKYADYTVTILARGPDPAGAAALVTFLLRSERRLTLARDGLNVPSRPMFSGRASAVPAGLRRAVGAG